MGYNIQPVLPEIMYTPKLFRELIDFLGFL